MKYHAISMKMPLPYCHTGVMLLNDVSEEQFCSTNLESPSRGYERNSSCRIHDVDFFETNM